MGARAGEDFDGGGSNTMTEKAVTCRCRICGDIGRGVPPRVCETCVAKIHAYPAVKELVEAVEWFLREVNWNKSFQVQTIQEVLGKHATKLQSTLKPFQASKASTGGE